MVNITGGGVMKIWGLQRFAWKSVFMFKKVDFQKFCDYLQVIKRFV